VKLIKWIVGMAAYMLFFLFLDDSGVGFCNQINHIRQWTKGNEKRLHFDAVWNRQKQEVNGR